MEQHLWKDNAQCLGSDTNLFFDTYEENAQSREFIDTLCKACPVARQCFAVGISGKEWGVWGGIYLEGGEVSKEFNSHKTKKDWFYTWQALTMEQ